MTHSGAGPSSRSIESRLQVLVALYQTERQQNQSSAQIMIGIVGAVLAFVALLTISGSGQTKDIPVWTLAFAPLIPLVLISWLVLYVAEAVVRRDYLISLEGEISRGLRSSVTPEGWIVGSWVTSTEPIWRPDLAWNGTSKWSLPYALTVFILNIGAALSVGIFVIQVLRAVYSRSLVAFGISLAADTFVLIVVGYVMYNTLFQKHVQRFKDFPTGRVP
jgi:hypothetical protein